MKKSYFILLNIKWQRLVSNDETCERCRSTEEEVDEAVRKARPKSRTSLGIEVKLEKEPLLKKNLKRIQKKSNKIYINGKSMEEWTDADTGQSECCDVCGDE